MGAGTGQNEAATEEGKEDWVHKGGRFSSDCLILSPHSGQVLDPAGSHELAPANSLTQV